MPRASFSDLVWLFPVGGSGAAFRGQRQQLSFPHWHALWEALSTRNWLLPKVNEMFQCSCKGFSFCCPVALSWWKEWVRRTSIASISVCFRRSVDDGICELDTWGLEHLPCQSRESPSTHWLYEKREPGPLMITSASERKMSGQEQSVASLRHMQAAKNVSYVASCSVPASHCPHAPS